jgi:hypothetical protein
VKTCSPNSRCERLECATCAWRYSGRTTARIEQTVLGPVYAVTFHTKFTTLSAFQQWRVSARNTVDHLRRGRNGRWWRDCGCHVWLDQQGHMCGVMTLGSITAVEIESTIGRRWPLALRKIEAGDLRVEVYRAMEPGKIWSRSSVTARYQGLRLSISPRRSTPLSHCKIYPLDRAIVKIAFENERLRRSSQTGNSARLLRHPRYEARPPCVGFRSSPRSIPYAA